jgi:hypothetical protein
MEYQITSWREQVLYADREYFINAATIEEAAALLERLQAEAQDSGEDVLRSLTIRAHHVRRALRERLSDRPLGATVAHT